MEHVEQLTERQQPVYTVALGDGRRLPLREATRAELREGVAVLRRAAAERALLTPALASALTAIEQELASGPRDQPA